MKCLNNLINDSELWHDALAVKILDAQRAFSYKKENLSRRPTGTGSMPRSRHGASYTP